MLVQEPTTRVQAPGLRETPAVSAEGRTFRRFLAQDVGPGTVVRVDPPRGIGVSRERVTFSVIAVVLAAMVIAFVVAARRRPTRSVVAASSESASRRLVREIAELDDAFEQTPDANDSARAEYEARRASLKSELAHMLADERKPT